jgi:dolichyl-diphosphooligosaccharide--protein glycosyltransferase
VASSTTTTVKSAGAAARVVDAALVLVCLAVAVLIRAVPAYDRVFHDGRVVFAGNDPWAHMRAVDNVAAHWPFPSWFDPYRLAPEGQWTDAPLMDVMIAGIAKAARLPLDVAGAWFPVAAGALIVVPVFLLTRRLFGRGEAWIAAFLIATLPGQLLQRSVLGNTDHHVLEALFAACVLLFLARAADRDSVGDAIIAGVLLGLYLLAWSRGAFLVIILAAWAVLEAATSRARITRLVAPTFLVALAIAWPAARHLPPMALTAPTLVGGVVLVALVEAARRRLPARRARTIAAAAAVAAVVIALAGLPALRQQLLRFVLTGGAATVGEVQPLLFIRGRFAPLELWSELTTASVLAAIGLVMLVRACGRDRSAARELLLVFSVVVIAATFAQVRFGYYLAIAAAMLAAIAARRWLWHGLARPVGAFAIAAVVIFPNVIMATTTAGAPTGAPTDAWIAALDWLRTHTPEPYGSPADYFAWHASAADAPPARYSVMVWSDYAWWVTRVARRPPATNPTQVAVKEAGRFYTSVDELQAITFLRERHARYVIADRSMPMSIVHAGQAEASQLEVMARWAERDPAQFYDLYTDHGLKVFLYRPEYYRTMAIRLFAYGGRGYIPARSTWAVRTNDRHEILESRAFTTFPEGAAFVSRDPKTWRIVGKHALLSPVPVEPLTIFVREFASPQGVDGPIGRIPEVAVFRVAVE